jgi:hypothetical protein
VPEKDLAAQLDRHSPALLGLLLDAMSAGLANLPKVEMDALPRMADSAKWIAACFPALGWTYEEWRQPYEESREALAETALGNSLPAACLLSWFNFNRKDRKEWTGTARELYDKLYPYVEAGKWHFFPGSPSHLVGSLTKIAPDLRRLHGIEFFRHPKKQRVNGVVVQLFTLRLSPTPSPVADVADCCRQDEGCRQHQLCDVPVGKTQTVADVADVADNFSTFTGEEKEKKRGDRPHDTQEIADLGLFVGNSGNSGNPCEKPVGKCQTSVADTIEACRQRAGNVGPVSATDMRKDMMTYDMGRGWRVQPTDKMGQWEAVNEDGRRHPATGSVIALLKIARDIVRAEDRHDRKRCPLHGG